VNEALSRRARLLSITQAGQQTRLAAQTEIQANESRILSRLPAADRRAFLRAARPSLAPGGWAGRPHWL
jgi:DNA-binding MarR family transcriptional regulator